jgi:glycosyltransferase involved in cell wall biosynthesis
LKPKVSICVPNLNTRPFLPERFETIFQQSFQDWELLVYDGYSEDGAWEYIQGLAAREPRMRAWQGPREGTPGSWTPCIRQAQGDYVYVATSDDTMAPDCLEKLVAALEEHPECDLAHCPLRAIDEKGQEVPTACAWWSKSSPFALSSGELVRRPHIRWAPFDGMLVLLGENVYISITQLLIRRSLFDRIGFFESRWGSVGDINWDMRASLVANTVHVPDTWGGWRLHPGQATAGVRYYSPENTRKVEEMIDDALGRCESLLPEPVRQRLNAQWSREAADMRRFILGLAARTSPSSRRGFILGRLLRGSRAARRYLKARFGSTRQSNWATETIRGWLQEVGIEPTRLLS